MIRKRLLARAIFVALSVVLLFAASLIQSPGEALADRVDELKNEIDERNEQIEALEAEIAAYRDQLDDVTAEKQSLQSTIRELDIARNKLGADIALTQERINRTDLEIEELQIDIKDKERRMDQNNDALGQTIRRMNEAESLSLVEAFLSHDNLSDVWDDVASLEQFQTFVRDDLKRLTNVKKELENQKVALEGKREELALLRADLAGQKNALDENRSDKNALLRETQNEEARYQEIIAEKQAAREQFEQELLDLSRELEFELDPSTIPPAGEGILSWPFERSYMQHCPSFDGALGNIYCLTQYFGNTAFATENASIYSGRGHNGVDFRAPSGTKINAALRGTVVGTGNTDLQNGCYSFGKWVMIEHNNGLSTLYAHLSAISVSIGQQVSTGQTIGFSGNTGYSTGPHLHFGVYATSGTRIVRLGDVKRRTNCSNVRVPVADLKAYLNPLSYL